MLFTTILGSSVGLTAPKRSTDIAAARTLPLLWSVWFPAISIRPGALNRITSSAAEPNDILCLDTRFSTLAAASSGEAVYNSDTAVRNFLFSNKLFLSYNIAKTVFSLYNNRC